VVEPVEVIVTRVAATAPVELSGPNAVTQSPIAREDEVVDCVWLTVVVFEVLILSFSVLGSTGLVGLLAFFVFEGGLAGLANPLRRMPDNEIEDPFTEMTFPLPMAKLASPAKL
jgi:hypothetical protein